MLDKAVPLAAHLADWAGDDAQRVAVMQTLLAVAEVAGELSETILQGPFSQGLSTKRDASDHGDQQAALDIQADDSFRAALKGSAVAWYGSEEQAEPVHLNPDGSLCLVIDPLDGSSNIDTNVSIGSIFGILPCAGGNGSGMLDLFRPGKHLLASGFVIYGPHTALVLTVGEGTDIFARDPKDDTFRLARAGVTIPQGQREYAINASNYRHWDEAIRTYVDDCIAGVEGPRGANFNMRWIASLVAEAFRILVRGGVFLYPADGRKGYENGRLRLVYEANPIAHLICQAGGRATNGVTDIHDLQPEGLHQRTPLVFGAKDKVDRVANNYAGPPPSTSERSPLFAPRGLFYHP